MTWFDYLGLATFGVMALILGYVFLKMLKDASDDDDGLGY